jgi:hypothetical protein
MLSAGREAKREIPIGSGQFNGLRALWALRLLSRNQDTQPEGQNRGGTPYESGCSSDGYRSDDLRPGRYHLIN